MAQVKVIYINADGFQQEHSETSDSIKVSSLLTANNELTDTALGALIGSGDGSAYHTHDSIYFRESEFINATAGVADAGKPIKTDAAGKIDGSFIDLGSIDHGSLGGLADDDHTQYSLASGTRAYTGKVSYSSHPSFSADTEIVDKKYVDDVVAATLTGLEWQPSVLSVELTPPGSPTTGDRYLINGVGTGAWATHDNKIAEWNGSAWVFTTPLTGMFVGADDEPTIVYYFGGTTWEAKSWEQTTASTGLVKVGYDIRLDSSSAGAGLGFSSGVLAVNVDASSIEIATDTLQVKADGIKDTHLDWGTGAGQISGVDIPLADGGAYFPTDNVEAALQYLAAEMVSQGVTYTVGGTGVNKGALVYVSGNNVVSPLSPLSLAERGVGLALTTEAAASTVKVLANDTVITGVLSGATAGDTYYWNGTTLTTTIPSGGSSHVYKCGQAKNSTDLHVEIEFIKRNA